MIVRRSAELGFRFEEIVAEILAVQGGAVERHVARWRGDRIPEVDIVWTRDDGAQAVEVKWTSLGRVSLSMLRDWASRAAALPRLAHRPMLVVAEQVEDSRREWAEREFDVTVWDRRDLDRMARDTPAHDRLWNLLSEAELLRAEWKAGRTVTTRPGAAQLGVEIAEDEAVPADLPTIPRGEELIEALADVPPGKGGAKAYEQICQSIINYLFGDHLLEPVSQSRLEDDLSILDVVYRVSPKHLFWSTLTRDFRARVIVFECKNYTDPIGPMQVFTTERYMSVAALRPICFILSRQAPHIHAELAAAGALRESGKLMICLSDTNLIDMLRLRDAQVREGPESAGWEQNDPTVLLDQRIYEFIARQPR